MAKSSTFINPSSNPTLAAIRNSGFDVEAALEASRQRLDRERARITDKYGDLSDGDIRRVLRVEDEQVECLGCPGTCGKDFFRYKRPTVTVVEGRVYITNVPCVYGIDQALRCDCTDAGIPDRYIGRDLSDYRVTTDNARAVKIAKYFIENKPRRSAFFYGSTGSGKTFLASLIAQSYVRDGLKVVMRDIPQLLTDIKATFDSKAPDPKISTTGFIDGVCNCDLLILDDMGTEKVTDWTSEMLYLIVNARYNKNRPLIAAANYDLDGLERRLGGDLTARRITSRIKEMCIEACFGTVDRRCTDG